jgi:uncharacterized cofD-like protein
MNLRRWLTVGIGVKRWLLVTFAGLVLLAVGTAHLLRQVTQDVELEGVTGAVIDVVTLAFLPYWLRGLTAGLLGATFFAYGAYRVIRALTEPVMSWDREQPLVEVIYQKRFLARGPRVVAIGGGTGLSMLLRGLKEHTSNLTAVVTVADDGGSTGKLRTELGIPAVGDIRNCIVALADAEPLMGRLLQYRFPSHATGVAPSTTADPTADENGDAQGLAGHAVGNLLLAALFAVEDGDFEEAVREMNRVLAVRGQVVPATATPLILHARLRDGREVEGQSAISHTSGVTGVWVEPGDVRATDDAIRAIAEAELIVLGPGSLYTSLLPALLVPGIREAIAASPAVRIYACNVATQDGETEDFDLADHVEALHAHGVAGLLDVVLANNRFDARPPLEWRAQPVRLRWPPASVPVEGRGGSSRRSPRLALDELVDPDNAHHHDPARLAAALLRTWERERGHPRRAAVVRSA